VVSDPGVKLVREDEPFPYVDYEFLRGMFMAATVLSHGRTTGELGRAEGYGGRAGSILWPSNVYDLVAPADKDCA